MKALQLKQKDIYWAGAVDKALRVFDVIMETEHGTTYNAYVLKTGGPVVLFETVKPEFFDEYIEKVQEITPLEAVEYLVVEHTEPDHAGSIERLIEQNPNIKIVGTACALGFLKHIVNCDFYGLPVKDNDCLRVGEKTLHFFALPNLHWPDTMYTWIEEEKALLCCDSFGAHYSFDGVLRSEVTDEAAYESAVKYYFDHIIAPFRSFMRRALDRIEGLDIELLCTGHGPVLDCNIPQLVSQYRKWCEEETKEGRKKVVIPYVSAYGYTTKLAENIAEGICASGEIDVTLYDMTKADAAAVLQEIALADGFLLGTPTILGDALKPIWDLTTSMNSIVHGGKYAAVFGSYGWSGEAVANLTQRLSQLKMKVQEGFRVKFKPDGIELIDAYEYGFQFGCLLLGYEIPKAAKSSRPRLVKCLICGDVFPEGTERCPVCGVGPEHFVPVEPAEVGYQRNTKQTYVVLGGGCAAVSAAQAIRERDSTATILLVSEEPVLPYNRPMLTKTMLADLDPASIAIRDKAWYQEQNIVTMLSRRAEAIDTEKKTVTLSDGMKLNYDKCIYALGARCFIPPIPGIEQEQVVAIRDISDVKKLQRLLAQAKRAVVIGGGVLGLEAAWELKRARCEVVILEAAPRLMSRQIDEAGSKLLCEIIQEAGIDVRCGVQIQEIQGRERLTGVLLASGESVPADLVVVSAGVRANTAVAEASGIAVKRAVIVDEHMRTSAPEVFACGDCAQFEEINYAIWPEAQQQGQVAGAAATGDELPYKTISAGISFQGMHSALFAAGDVGSDPQTEYKTVEISDPVRKQYQKCYFINNRLSGAILIGDIRKAAEIDAAIQEKRRFSDMF